MATIKNSIELIDNASQVMAKIANAGTNLENKFTRIERTATKAGNAAEGASGKFSMLKSVFAGDLMANAFTAALDMAKGAVMGFFNLGDQYAGIQARLQLIGGSLENANYLNNQIYESAQRARGAYLDTANAVGQLAMSAKDAFPDPREAVTFMEGINKLYAIGGTSQQNRKFATLQLTQGMASGALMGDEFRSIAENAPIIENMIAKTMGVSRGELKGLASEGKVTADIIKRAILENMDEINSQFEVAPKQWGDHLTDLQSYATHALGPVLKQLSEVANSDGVKKLVAGIKEGIDGALPVVSAFVNGIQYGINKILPFLEAVQGGLSVIFQEITPYIGVFIAAVRTGFDITVGIITGAFNFISEHSGIVKLALIGVAGALAFMGTMSLISAGRVAIATVAMVAKSAADWLETAALIALTLAQDGFNAALYACPITWIIGLVIALIAIFYGAIAVINYFADTSISATGIIAGTFAWLGAFIWNIILFLWNSFISFAEFIRNVFKDPLAATHNLFADIWNGIFDMVKDIINGIIELYNKIPGVTKVSVLDVQTGKIAHKEVAGGYDFSNLKMKPLDPNNEAAYAYGIGDNLSKLGDNLFNGGNIPKTIMGGYDPTKNGQSSNRTAAENAKANKDTAKNTKRMADAIEMTDDEIKEMRDVAVNNVIQSWQNKNVVINVTNNNDVSSDVDIDGFNNDLLQGLRQAFTENGEGVMI